MRHFLEQEPIPGIEFEYKIAATYLPTVTGDEVSALAKELITDENRVVLGVAPEKKDVPPPTTDTLRAAIARASTAPVERWADATAGRALVEKPPAAGKVASRAHGPGDRRHGADAVERRRGVAQADRLQERSGPVHRLRARRHVARRPSRLQERRASPRRWSASAAWAASARWISSKMLSGKIAQASPTIGDYTQGISGSSTPKDLETALQLNYLAHTAPNMTPDVLDLLKRRLDAVAAEPRSEPARGVRREGRAGQHVEPLQRRSADDGRRADARTSTRCSAFYSARFANAADFTYFFVGAFTVDEITPLLEKWVASLPSTGQEDVGSFRDMGVQVPGRRS